MAPIRTIDDMNSFFDRLKECDNWSLHLLKITSSKKLGVLYYARQISLYPAGKISEVAKYADEMEFEKLPDPERFLTCRAVKEAYRIYTRKRNLRIARYINLEFSMK